MTAFVRGWSSAAKCRWCSTPTRSTPSPTSPACCRAREGRDVIITPHPGEMARLIGCTIDDVQANRLGVARDFARRHRVYVVLKGYRTLIATPDGPVFVNPDRHPGHGDRRHRRRADRHGGRVAGAAARRRGRVPACGLPARRGRRARRRRRRRSVDDRRRSRRSHRRRDPRADRAPPRRQAVAASREPRPARSRIRGRDARDCRRELAARPEARATLSCCPAISARARRRSSAAWPKGSASTRQRSPARPSRWSTSIAAAGCR